MQARETYSVSTEQVFRFYFAMVTAAVAGGSAFFLLIIARIEPLDATQVPIFAQNLVRTYIEPWDADLKDIERWFWFAFVSLIFILAFLMFFVFFVNTIYPQIPDTYGGGKPKFVQLLLASEGLEGYKQLGIPMSNSQSQLSKPVSILFEGANTYVLQLPDNRVVQIDKRMIVGSFILQD
jgi:hypothetical protein